MNRLALLPLIATMLAACAGTAARQDVLLPAMSAAWASIKVQVQREASHIDSMQAAEAVAAADAAFATADPVKFAAVNWGVLDALALADIDRRLDAQQIGVQVAQSLRGRVVDFAAARGLYLRRNQ